MQNVIVYPTQTTPFVYTDFELGAILISGIALPERAMHFFEPLQNWIAEFLSNETRELSIHLDLDYLNNAASLAITDLIRSLNKREQIHFKIIWHYYSDDDDVFEDGEDFASIAKFPFEFCKEDFSMNYSVPKTPYSPLVYFDSLGDFVISGNCIVEQPLLFYLPIIKWLNRYRIGISDTAKRAVLEIDVNEINTRNKYFLKAILNQMDIYKLKGFQTSISWKNNVLSIEL